MLTRIDDLLRMAISFGASDLHLRAGASPVIRVNGELKPLAGVTKLNQDETLEMAFSMMSNRQKMHFKEAYEVDIGYGVSGLGRFRVNIFQQRGVYSIVMRVIPTDIPTVRSLGLPEQLEEIADAATQALDESKEIAYNLRPFQLDRLGSLERLATESRGQK